MLKRRLLLLRPADLPRLPADTRRLCRPAFPPPVAQRRKGSGYRVNESLPELIPFNQQVHQVLTDAPPKPLGFIALLPESLQRGRALPAPRPFRPLGRRSSRIPALLYPPPRCVQGGRHQPRRATILQPTAITPLNFVSHSRGSLQNTCTP